MNGKGNKAIKTIDEEVAIETPIDRNSIFTPEITKKR
jgi:hypothetical protein